MSDTKPLREMTRKEIEAHNAAVLEALTAKVYTFYCGELIRAAASKLRGGTPEQNRRVLAAVMSPWNDLGDELKKVWRDTVEIAAQLTTDEVHHRLDRIETEAAQLRADANRLRETNQILMARLALGGMHEC